jgi:hypothetical protein
MKPDKPTPAERKAAILALISKAEGQENQLIAQRNDINRELKRIRDGIKALQNDLSKIKEPSLFNVEDYHQL